MCFTKSVKYIKLCLISTEQPQNVVTEYQCTKTSGPGPHPNSCLRIWWLNAGCTMRGTKVHEESQINYWNQHSIEAVQNDMSNYYRYAIDDQFQYLCFGVAQ